MTVCLQGSRLGFGDSHSQRVFPDIPAAATQDSRGEATTNQQPHFLCVLWFGEFVIDIFFKETSLGRPCA